MSSIDWLNRLAKWRSVLAGWQLGTRSSDDPESNAVRDHREATLLARAELNALAGLLLDKKVITAEELSKAVMVEAQMYCEDLEKRFPGFKAADDGMGMDARVAQTTKGWRP